MDPENDAAPAAEGRVEVPPDALSPELLRRVIEEFVTRDGTDYGAIERSLDEKVEAVRRQLDAGEALILVDPEEGSVDIVLRSPR